MSTRDTITGLLLEGVRHGVKPSFSLVAAEDSSVLSTITFAGVVEEGGRAAARLRASGVRRGSRVVIVARPNPHWIATFAGTLFAGGVAVPVNHSYRQRELAAILTACAPTVVVVDASTREAAVAAVEEVRSGAEVLELDAILHDASGQLEPEAMEPSDLAVILHTSGTTGVPKGVEHTHGEYALFMRRWGSHAISPGDRIMSFLPLYHQAGLVCSFLCGHTLGAPVYHVDRFSRSTFWDTVDALGLTWAVLMQPVPRYLLESPPAADDRAHALKWVIATMSPEDWVRFQARFGVDLQSSYGSTESTIVRMTGGRHAGPVARERVHGPLGGALCGRPFEDWAQARIVTAEGEPASVEEPGLIEVRGDPVFKRYFRNRDASREAFTEDGWFKTGDRGYLAASGDMYMLERVSAVIRRSGENIAPREIEEVLELHPAVAEAAAVGVADELRGQEIAAFVVLRPDAELDLAELFDFCREQLAYFKVPRYLEVRASLPQTPTFKVRREALSISEAAVDRQSLPRGSGV